MKGLLYKDWTLIVGGYKTNFILILVLYGFLAHFSHAVYLAYALMFIVGMYASSTISMDENSQWDTYAHTLPVSAGQLIASKYLLSLFATFVGAVLAFLLVATMPNPYVPSFLEVMVGLAITCAVTFVYFSLVIPLSYRFNSIRARSWVSISILVLVFGSAALYTLIPEETINQIQQTLGMRGIYEGEEAIFGSLVTWTENQLFMFTVVALLLFSIVILLVSWAISVRIYAKKNY